MNSMRQGSYSKADSCLAEKEVLHLLLAQSSLLYSKKSATGSYLGQIIPAHILTLCIHGNIIPPSTSTSPK
jgi:hypothetical protein